MEPVDFCNGWVQLSPAAFAFVFRGARFSLRSPPALSSPSEAANVRHWSAIRFQAASSSATRAGSLAARLFVSQRSVARL